MPIDHTSIPASSGTYLLILQLEHAAQVTIGRLGLCAFPAGWYGYVGSAFGPGGLRGRLKHHLTPVRRPHWHIDYLRSTATVTAVCWHASNQIEEHHWATRLAALPGACIAVRRFGSSDCDCTSHLVQSTAQPVLETLGSVVGFSEWLHVLYRDHFP